MPHQCTGCGRTFADGSKEMLSGCPDCGGNKFQFQPAGASAPSDGKHDGTVEDERPNQPAAAGELDRSSADGSNQPTADGSNQPTADEKPSSSAHLSAGTRPSDQPSASAEQQQSRTEHSTRAEVEDSVQAGVEDSAQAEVDNSSQGEIEDSAQADARTGMVREEDLPPQSPPSESPSEPPSESEFGEVEDTQPDLQQLREELNDQFESIRILEPGQYELNLMELYNRNEYIISLREDGRYVIDVPDTWED